MTPYDAYCLSVNKAPDTVPRSTFNAAYNMLVAVFRRVTGRLVVPPTDAQYIIFLYVTELMGRVSNGEIVQERIGDYSYVRENASLSDKLIEYEVAIQQWVLDATLSVGISNEEEIACACRCQ